jgi:hypothetical protein
LGAPEITGAIEWATDLGATGAARIQAASRTWRSKTDGPSSVLDWLQVNAVQCIRVCHGKDKRGEWTLKLLFRNDYRAGTYLLVRTNTDWYRVIPFSYIGNHVVRAR